MAHEQINLPFMRGSLNNVLGHSPVAKVATGVIHGTDMNSNAKALKMKLKLASQPF